MLFDKNILNMINEKLNAQYPKFNTNIFLLMLEITSRYIGFPPTTSLTNYYENFVKGTIKETNNPYEQGRCLKGVYLIMVCFGYLHDTLDTRVIDDQFENLLNKAIESRFATTEEEIDAEKHLLLMLIKNPIEVLKLISEHSESLERENMSELIGKRIVDKENHDKEKNVDCSALHKEIFESTLVGVEYLKGRQRESYLKIISTYLQNQKSLEGSLNQTALNTNGSVNTKGSFIEHGSERQNHSFFPSNKKKTDEVPMNLWYRIFSGSI